MDDPVIRVAELISERVKVRQAYAFTPRRLTWAARLAWWTLRKLRALTPEDVFVTHHTLRVKHERNSRVSAAIAEVIAGVPPEELDRYALVVGRPEFMELMGERNFFPLYGGAQLMSAELAYRGQLYGVPFQVVDRLSGIALIPRVVIEERRRG